jgi:hypothetical protein
MTECMVPRYLFLCVRALPWGGVPFRDHPRCPWT